MNIQRLLNQTAVYWGNPVVDAWGATTYDSPVEVKVRWTEKQEAYLSSLGGPGTYEEKLSRVVVISETDFEVKGRMMLGELTDLTSDQLPESNNALIIDGYAKIPDRLARQYLRRAWLI
jgi:hypothetical protein